MSHEAALLTQADPERSALARLLGPAFGFFVWAAHLLVVYGATAVACVVGLGADRHTAFLTALGLVTVAAAALTSWHALRSYRRWRTDPERGFRWAIAAGCNALATVAIAWQIFAIALVPVCA
jgi:hypothetical protein